MNITFEKTKAVYRLFLAILEVDLDAVLKECNNLQDNKIDDKAIGCNIAIQTLEIMSYISNVSLINLKNAWFDKYSEIMNS